MEPDSTQWGGEDQQGEKSKGERNKKLFKETKVEITGRAEEESIHLLISHAVCLLLTLNSAHLAVDVHNLHLWAMQLR